VRDGHFVCLFLLIVKEQEGNNTRRSKMILISETIIQLDTLYIWHSCSDGVVSSL